MTDKCSQVRLADDYSEPMVTCACGKELRVQWYPRQGVKRPFMPSHATGGGGAPSGTHAASEPRRATLASAAPAAPQGGVVARLQVQAPPRRTRDHVWVDLTPATPCRRGKSCEGRGRSGNILVCAACRMCWFDSEDECKPVSQQYDRTHAAVVVT